MTEKNLLEAFNNFEIWPEPIVLGKIALEGSWSQTDESTIQSRSDEIENIGKGRYCSVAGDSNEEYLMVVRRGPFFQPIGKKGDDLALVGAQLRYPDYKPEYYGRSEASILGLIDDDGNLQQHYSRPTPYKPVMTVDDDRLSQYLGLGGSVRIGTLIGPQPIPAAVEADQDGNFPSHLGVWGTIGHGKSTTLNNLLGQFQGVGKAVIVLDRDGEFTAVDQPADDPGMLRLFAKKGLTPKGLKDPVVYVPKGWRPRNPEAPNLRFFTLPFEDLSPYAFARYIKLSPDQEDALFAALEIAEYCMRRFLRISGPLPDLYERGYRGMTFDMLDDVIRLITSTQTKDDDDPPRLMTPEFEANKDEILKRITSRKLKQHKPTWTGIVQRVQKLRRLGIFDVKGAEYPDFDLMRKRGMLTVFDFNEVQEPDIRNMIMLIVLANTERRQRRDYGDSLDKGTASELVHVEVVIEEAHDLIGKSRSKDIPASTLQIQGIAARGRKFRLGLVIVSHVPDQIDETFMSLFNNHIIHSLPNQTAVRALHAAVPNSADDDWDMVRNLRKGEALVSFRNQWTSPLTLKMQPGRAKSLTPNSESN